MDVIVSWEATYAPHIKVLGERARKEAEGDGSRRVWLRQPFVVEKIQVEEMSWNCGVNPWYSSAEADFKANDVLMVPVEDQIGGICGIDDREILDRNKALFVTLVQNGENFLSDCPIITIQQGDFLGILAGHIRFTSNFDSAYHWPATSKLGNAASKAVSRVDRSMFGGIIW